MRKPPELDPPDYPLFPQALIDTLLEMGSDRVLFSVDTPYETVQEQSDWFDSLPISGGITARSVG
jgi:predicted TIM-barrel fold metal-dependent hydrolase